MLGYFKSLGFELSLLRRAAYVGVGVDFVMSTDFKATGTLFL